MALDYENIDVGKFEDRSEHLFGNEFRFLIWPTTSIVAEYRYQIVSYFHEGEIIVPAIKFFGIKLAPPIRLQQDSTTNFFGGGFDHIFNPRLGVSFRGGAEFREFEAGGDESSPYFDGILNYAVGKRTVVTWSNHYGLEQGSVAANQGRTTFRTGLTAKHDITARLLRT